LFDKTGIIEKEVNFTRNTIQKKVETYQVLMSTVEQDSNRQLEQTQNRIKKVEDSVSQNYQEQTKALDAATTYFSERQNSLETKMKEIKFGAAESIKQIKTLEGMLAINATQQEKESQIIAKQQLKKEQEIDALEDEISEIRDHQKKQLESMGAVSFDHSLMMISKIFLLSHSIQQQHGHAQSLSSAIGSCTEKVQVFLDRVQAIKEKEWQEIELDQPEFSSEELVKWAQQSWKQNPEIAENIEKTAIGGKVLMENLDTEEFLDELQIKSPIMRAVWKGRWGGAAQKKSVEQKKLSIQQAVENLEILFHMDRNTSKEAKKNLENAVDKFKNKLPLPNVV